MLLTWNLNWHMMQASLLIFIFILQFELFYHFSLASRLWNEKGDDCVCFLGKRKKCLNYCNISGLDATCLRRKYTNVSLFIVILRIFLAWARIYQVKQMSFHIHGFYLHSVSSENFWWIWKYNHGVVRVSLKR